MLIDKYIENALYIYECVIIPGFGGFLAEQTPAAVASGRSSSLAAPSKKFAFNRTLRVNDGVLANYVANIRSISYNEAIAEINAAVDHWLTLLETGEAVIIENVGQICEAEDGSWVFTPAAAAKNYSRDSYGLSAAAGNFDSVQQKDRQAVEPSFTFEAVSANPARQNMEENTVQAETENKESKKSDEERLMDFLSNYSAKNKQQEAQGSGVQSGYSAGESDYPRTKDQVVEFSNRNYKENTVDNSKDTSFDSYTRLKREKPKFGISPLAIIIPVMLICGALAALYFLSESAKKELEKQELTASLAAERDSIASLEEQLSVQLQDEEAITEHTVTTTTAATKPAKTSSYKYSNAALDKKYYVIAAAVETDGQADAMIAGLCSKGFDAVPAGTTDKGLRLVAYGAFDSKDEMNDLYFRIVAEVDRNTWVKITR